MAYARMAWNYKNSGDIVRANENARTAYDLRQRASERERFYIESAYEMNVTGNLESAREIYELWTQTYPQDDVPPNDLGVIYGVLGEREKALAAFQQSMKLDPGNGISYANLAYVYLGLNRLDEAKATIQEAQAHGLDFPNLHFGLYRIAFLEKNAAGMEREVANLKGRPGIEGPTLYMESETAAYRGRLSRAHELADRAIGDSKSHGRVEAAAGYQVQSALREALVGNLALAKHQTEDTLKLSDSKYIVALSAVVLGLVGDSAKANRMADELARRDPENTSLQFHYLPMIRGAVAMQRGESAKALEAFDVGAPYELGNPAWMSFIALYPVYLHGEACLSAHQGALAATQFQKILDHAGRIGNELIGALAHLGLGRAYAMAGDSPKAKTAYQDFLGLWKDADPDIPILKEAKAEYAKLQ
jgi:tetratricopeptide (TPR) repeat protein